MHGITFANKKRSIKWYDIIMYLPRMLKMVLAVMDKFANGGIQLKTGVIYRMQMQYYFF